MKLIALASRLTMLDLSVPELGKSMKCYPVTANMVLFVTTGRLSTLLWTCSLRCREELSHMRLLKLRVTKIINFEPVTDYYTPWNFLHDYLGLDKERLWR